MPEGDTIHGLARRLAPRIVGRRIDAVDLREVGGAEALVGTTVTGVEAVGKHLLIHTDGGLTLRTHLGMNGRWREVPVGRAVQPRPRVDLRFGDRRIVCVEPPQLELFATRDRARNEALAALGPDLLGPAPDRAEILRRARHPANQARPVGEVLVDQRVAAGFGNVFKSELCFLHAVDPFRPLAEIGDAALWAIYEEGAALLATSVAQGERIFTLGPRGARPRARGARLWVYGRAGRPCFACGALVRQQRQGDLARVTYWCPSCQAPSVR